MASRKLTSCVASIATGNCTNSEIKDMYALLALRMTKIWKLRRSSNMYSQILGVGGRGNKFNICGLDHEWF